MCLIIWELCLSIDLLELQIRLVRYLPLCYYIIYHLFCREFMFFNAICICIDVYWCPTRFPYQMIFLSCNSKTTGVTSGGGIDIPSRAPEFTPGYLWGSCCSIFSFLCNVLLIIICLFSVGHCIVCPSIYGFWIPLWCLQTSLNNHENVVQEMQSSICILRQWNWCDKVETLAVVLYDRQTVVVW